MNIFITGATGFIGTELLQQLKDTGHELICLVRKTSPNLEKVKAMGVTVVEGDVRDKASVLKGMKGCDWVVNLAALYSFWQVDNDLYRETNVAGTRNVMECALETRVSKVVHISSVVAFGKPADAPFNENSEVGPRLFSRYAKTKHEGGKLAYKMYKEEELPLVVLYLGAVVGGADNQKTTGLYISDVVNGRLPAQVFTQVPFTWVHVKDTAEAIIKSLEKEGNIGEKYIIGKEVITLGELNSMISEISGVELPKMKMPNWLALAGASLLTGISRLTKKEPPLRMYFDQVLTMSKGFHADGSKAARELGITYTPIRMALEEELGARETKVAEMV